MKKLLPIIFILLVAGQAWGATYTIGSGGNYSTFSNAFTAQSGAHTYLLLNSISENVVIGADEDGAIVDLGGFTLTGYFYDGAADIDNLTIRNGVITGSTSNGITLSGGGDSPIIESITVAGATNHGMWIENADTPIIRNCVVYGSGDGGSVSDDNVHVENCVDFLGENITSYSPTQGSCLDASDSGGSSCTGTWRNNTVLSGASGHPSIKVSGSGATSTFVVSFNIISGGYAGISAAETCDVNIYNNTIKNMTFSGITNSTSGTSNYKNNIVDTCVRGVVLDTAPTSMDFNNYYGNSNYLGRNTDTNTYTTIATWRAATSLDANSIVVNPRLTSNYVPTEKLVANGGTLGSWLDSTSGLTRYGSGPPIGAKERPEMNFIPRIGPPFRPVIGWNYYTATETAYALLLETGDTLLLESGDKLLLE